MMKLLARLFIKNSGDTSDPAVRMAYGRLCGMAGIALNLLLFALKYFAGIVSGSIAITADAFNNLSDAGSSVITLAGFALAGKRPDPHHPFGHGRLEYIAGLAVAAVIVVMGAELLRSSVGRIFAPEPVQAGLLSAAILAVSIAVKLYMAAYNRRIGRMIDSPAIAAASADSLSDSVATAVVLVCMLVTQFTGHNIDAYAGVVVAGFILFAGFSAARDTVSPLLGQAPSREFVRQIEDIVLKNPEILGIHDLIVHDYGPGRRFASVHAEIDHRIDPLIAHELLDEIERQVKKELHVELVIHYDPIVTDDPEVTAVKERLQAIIHDLDPRLSIHDFRMVSGQHHANVIFDMVIPADLESRTAELRRTIEARLQDGKKTYHLVVTFDTAAFNEMTTEAEAPVSRKAQP